LGSGPSSGSPEYHVKLFVFLAVDPAVFVGSTVILWYEALGLLSVPAASVAYKLGQPLVK